LPRIKTTGGSLVKLSEYFQLATNAKRKLLSINRNRPAEPCGARGAAGSWMG